MARRLRIESEEGEGAATSCGLPNRQTMGQKNHRLRVPERWWRIDPKLAKRGIDATAPAGSTGREFGIETEGVRIHRVFRGRRWRTVCQWIVNGRPVVVGDDLMTSDHSDSAPRNPENE